MPTNDDAPITPRLTGDSLTGAEVSSPTKLSQSDLITIFDVSTKTVKSMTVLQFAAALGITLTP
jgi:hypothetical protein